MKKWLDQYKNGGNINSLNRKVTCSNCGWSWKLSDGGLDPMTCHKCGGDIKMKEGGELDEYQDRGEFRYTVPRSDNLQYQKPIVSNFIVDPLSGGYVHDPARAAALLNQPTNAGTISKTKDRSVGKQIYNVATNPMTSAQQLINKQPVTGLGPKNPYDLAFDAFPAMMAARQLPQIPGNIQRGEYLQAGLNALTAVPLLPKVPRGLPKVFSEGQPYEGAPHIYQDMYPINGRYQPRTVITDAGVKNEILGLEPTPVVPTNAIEYPVTPNKFLNQTYDDFGRMEPGVVTYTYRDMPPGTNTYTSTLPSYTSFPNNNFQSEINWAEWNKEIPKNTPLIKEYNVIEKIAKENGTWMKNSDGSPFKGTPEQFVQQNSQNFKKAFGNTQFKDQYGNPLFFHHGSINEFSEFLPPTKTHISNTGYKGNYSFFHPNKDMADEYVAFLPGNEKYSNVKSVYINSKNPLIHENVSDPESYINNINLKNYDAISNRTPEELSNLHKGDPQILSNDDYDYLQFSEVAVPYGNNVKSAIGNNGMFDMTNPNIYKTIIPAAIGVGALNQKQQGGPIVTNRGQWDYPGQTTIIPSNQITMQGVPYPVVGVDNTGHTKMMQPGMNYTFPGQYVTEYPMAQNGYQVPITNNLFNRTFRDKQLIKQEILDENPALQQVMTLDNMNINYARRNQRRLLEKLHHNPEYFDKDNNQNGILDNQNDTDDGYPYSGNIYTSEGVIKNPNPGEFTTLINKRGMNRQQIKDAAANDFISHSLHYSPQYQDYSNKLNQMLLTKHPAKMIEENGGVDAYMRSIFTEDPSYFPYKEEMSFIDPNFINEIKSYVKGISKKEQGGEMIKRADGSYSRRGLWDNIRANRGSGKKPTKEMLEQERKIRNKYQNGGLVYNVKEGDNLSTIAKNYNIPLNQLVQTNNIKNPDLILTGQKLIIPKNSRNNDAEMAAIADKRLKYFESQKSSNNKQKQVAVNNPYFVTATDANRRPFQGDVTQGSTPIKINGKYVGKKIDPYILEKSIPVAAGIAAAPFVAPALAGALPVISSAMSAPLTIGATTVPWVTPTTVIGAGFGLKGANKLNNDLASNYYTNPNISKFEKVVSGFETGLDLLGMPGAVEAIGSHLISPLFKGLLKTGQYVSDGSLPQGLKNVKSFATQSKKDISEAITNIKNIEATRKLHLNDLNSNYQNDILGLIQDPEKIKAEELPTELSYLKNKFIKYFEGKLNSRQLSDKFIEDKVFKSIYNQHGGKKKFWDKVHGFGDEQFTNDELKNLYNEISSKVPSKNDASTLINSEFSKLKKQQLYNPLSDAPLIQDFVANKFKLSKPEVLSETNFLDDEKETLSAIRALGKFKSINQSKKKIKNLLTIPEAVEQLYKHASKIDDSRLKSILPNISREDIITAYEKLKGSGSTVNNTNQQIPQIGNSLPQELTELDPYFRKLALHGHSQYNPSLFSNFVKNYQTSFVPSYNIDAISKSEKLIPLIGNTHHEFDIAPNPKFVNNSSEPEHILIDVGHEENGVVLNPRVQFLQAIKNVENAKKGSKFIGSNSLSTDSYPIVNNMGIKFTKNGLVVPKFSGYMTGLNELGYATKNPDLAIKEINSQIEALEKLSGKTFPKAKYIKKNYLVPQIYFEKLKYGGQPYFQQGGVVLNAGGEKHRIYVKTTNRGEGAKGHIMVNHPTMDKGMWDTIDLTEKAGATTIAQGVAATKKWHRENPYKKQDGGEEINWYYPKQININEGFSYYEPNTETYYFNPNNDIQNQEAVKQHELYHHLQNINGRLQLPQYYSGPLKKPNMMMNGESQGAYYNRRGIDEEKTYDIMVKRSPELQFVPRDILYNGMQGSNGHIPGTNDMMYENPYTVEGEARDYENYIRAGGKPIFANGGYVVRRSHDRKGKTHVVIGPDGTKKYFGDPNMGERGKSKYGKEAFYARHKSNLAKNPYFRAYARATWEEGGETYAIGGQSTLNPIVKKDNRNWLDYLKN